MAIAILSSRLIYSSAKKTVRCQVKNIYQNQAVNSKAEALKVAEDKVLAELTDVAVNHLESSCL